MLRAIHDSTGTRTAHIQLVPKNPIMLKFHPKQIQRAIDQGIGQDGTGVMSFLLPILEHAGSRPSGKKFCAVTTLNQR